MKPLLSAQCLAWRLGIPLPELRKLAQEANKHYRDFPLIDREKGKSRILKVPDNEFKTMQRRILKNVLAEFPLPVSLHGGVHGHSPKTNAEQHLGKALVVNLDIYDFFPSIDHRQVARMFRNDFGCGRETMRLLTRLTTVDGELPQGAPTSTMIANLLLATPVDGPVNAYARERGVAFTRFVDDMTFSGERADELINEAAKAASRVWLKTWRKRKKLKITPRSRRQEVTGLTVNSPAGPSVSRPKRDKIRAAIHALTKMQNQSDVEKQLQSIRGRLNHLQQFNQGSAKRLRRQLARTLREHGTHAAK
jgi:hypothetical protein